MNAQMEIDACTCYPGWYVPSAEVRDMLLRFGQLLTGKIRRLHLKLVEFDHYYRLVVPIPASSKEDLVVYTHDDQLVVSVRHPVSDNYAHTSVLLPPDADVEFSSAEYKGERLEICLSRSTGKAKKCDHQIVVY